MMNRSCSWMVAVIIILGGATTAMAEQIVNGGFELPPLPAGTDFVDVTGDFITGWTIPDGWTIDLVRDYWPAFQGSQSIDLDGDSGIGTTILQSFATVPGQAYSLSFAYANNIDASTATGRVQVLGTTTPGRHDPHAFRIDARQHELPDLRQAVHGGFPTDHAAVHTRLESPFRARTGARCRVSHQYRNWSLLLPIGCLPGGNRGGLRSGRRGVRGRRDSVRSESMRIDAGKEHDLG